MVCDVSESLPAWSEAEDACRALKLGMEASELHGAVCGWLAGGGTDGDDWLAKALVDDNPPAVAAGSALDRLHKASAAQLEDRSFGFDLLLPDDDNSLAVRSEALFDWCRGFLGAFGLAAGQDPRLSEEGREALADIAKLAAAVAQDDGDDEDEAALSEIEEFVRVAVLLLHGDCALGPRHRNRLN
jgi:uncharacterized protein YgfB (UPF0149 family)